MPCRSASARTDSASSVLGLCGNAGACADSTDGDHRRTRDDRIGTRFEQQRGTDGTRHSNWVDGSHVTARFGVGRHNGAYRDEYRDAASPECTTEHWDEYHAAAIAQCPATETTSAAVPPGGDTRNESSRSLFDGGRPTCGAVQKRSRFSNAVHVCCFNCCFAVAACVSSVNDCTTFGAAT